MHILFSCNSHYVMPLSVCLTSLLEHNTKNDIHVYLLHSDVTEAQQKIIKNLVEKYHQKISIIHVNDTYFAEAPALRWSKETYYRLLLGELLPENLDRLLYLDVDIIIQKPLEELYWMSLDKNMIAALPEHGNDTVAFRTRLGLDPDGTYYQAGVLLFDVPKVKTILNYNTAMQTIRLLGKNLIAVDQDVLNVMFDGKITPINTKFNNCEITRFNDSNWQRFCNHVDTKEFKETYIFHYASSKPWNNLFFGSCENLWYQYLKQSPYAYLYNQKFNTVRYKILRMGVTKVLLYEYAYLTPFINHAGEMLLPSSLYDSAKKFYRNHIK